MSRNPTSVLLPAIREATEALGSRDVDAIRDAIWGLLQVEGPARVQTVRRNQETFQDWTLQAQTHGIVETIRNSSPRWP